MEEVLHERKKGLLGKVRQGVLWDAVKPPFLANEFLAARPKQNETPEAFITRMFGYYDSTPEGGSRAPEDCDRQERPLGWIRHSALRDYVPIS